MADGIPTAKSPFQAQDVATPIGKANSVELGIGPSTAYEALRGDDFDQAPVVNANRVVGWVRTDRLREARRVKNAYTTLANSALVAADSPLDVAIAELGRYGFVFTVGHNGVSGFITPSDLDKHVVRTHFYLAVSAVEILLSEIVDRAVPRNNVLERICQNSESRQRWESALAERLDLRPVEYLYLEDLAELYRGGPGQSSPHWAKSEDDRLVALCQLRARIMHPTRPLLGQGNPTSLASVAATAQGVISALHRVHDETFPETVQHSQALTDGR